MSGLLPTSELRKPTKFAHIVLRSKHFEETIAWYEAVLGTTVVHRNPMLCFVTYDDEHHRLAFVNVGNAEDPAPGAVGADHIAYSYGSMGDLLQNYKRLRERGILPHVTVNHGPTTSLYYRDPDGMGVELQVDNFATEKELKGWMQSGAFEKNPIGVRFDADILLERYENGDPIEELTQQGSA